MAHGPGVTAISQVDAFKPLPFFLLRTFMTSFAQACRLYTILARITVLFFPRFILVWLNLPVLAAVLAPAARPVAHSVPRVGRVADPTSPMGASPTAENPMAENPTRANLMAVRPQGAAVQVTGLLETGLLETGLLGTSLQGTVPTAASPAPANRAPNPGALILESLARPEGDRLAEVARLREKTTAVNLSLGLRKTHPPSPRRTKRLSPRRRLRAMSEPILFLGDMPWSRPFWPTVPLIDCGLMLG